MYLFIFLQLHRDPRLLHLRALPRHGLQTPVSQTCCLHLPLHLPPSARPSYHTRSEGAPLHRLHPRNNKLIITTSRWTCRRDPPGGLQGWTPHPWGDPRRIIWWGVPVQVGPLHHHRAPGVSTDRRIHRRILTWAGITSHHHMERHLEALTHTIISITISQGRSSNNSSSNTNHSNHTNRWVILHQRHLVL